MHCSRTITCNGGERMQAQGTDWRVLSEAASREQDPEKLIELVEELNRTLLHREIEARRRYSTNYVFHRVSRVSVAPCCVAPVIHPRRNVRPARMHHKVQIKK